MPGTVATCARFSNASAASRLSWLIRLTSGKASHAPAGGAPVIFESDVCAVSYQGRVSCFELASGSPRWNRDLSSEVGVAVDQRFVFAADDKGAGEQFVVPAPLDAELAATLA